MTELYLRLRNHFNSEEGQDLIEYALLVVFIAIIVLIVLPLVGSEVSSVFDYIQSKIGSVPS